LAGPITTPIPSVRELVPSARERYEGRHTPTTWLPYKGGRM